MKGKAEQAWVGVFVLVAAGLLIGAVLAVSGTFSKGGVEHHAYFKFAGGLVPGAKVRYGGMRAGRVEAVQVDPEDSTRIKIDFNIGPDIPLKTDSVAKITTLGALDENYLELSTGTKEAPLAPPGSVVKSAESLGIGQIGDVVGGLAPVAQQTLQNLNQRLDELQVTIARVNDLLNDRNRANIGRSLENVNAMLAEDRPKLSATLTNVQTASARLAPLLDNLKTTMGQANDTLSHLDSIVVENREDLRASVAQLRQALVDTSALIDQIRGTLDYNTDNIDQSLENVRVATDNLKQLTETVKRRPSVLLRGETAKDRQPGAK